MNRTQFVKWNHLQSEIDRLYAHCKAVIAPFSTQLGIDCYNIVSFDVCIDKSIITVKWQTDDDEYTDIPFEFFDNPVEYFKKKEEIELNNKKLEIQLRQEREEKSKLIEYVVLANYLYDLYGTDALIIADEYHKNETLNDLKHKKLTIEQATEMKVEAVPLSMEKIEREKTRRELNDLTNEIETEQKKRNRLFRYKTLKNDLILKYGSDEMFQKQLQKPLTAVWPALSPERV